MQEADTIQVLGRGTSVDFTIDDTVPFEIAERSLREYLEVCRGLYSSGTVSVNVGRRILAPDQLSAIKQILDSETGLKVTRYWCAPEILQSALYAMSAAGSLVAHQLSEAAHSPPESEYADVAAGADSLPKQEAAEGWQLSFEFKGLHSQPAQPEVLQQAPEFLLKEFESLDLVEVNTDTGKGPVVAVPRSAEHGPFGKERTSAKEDSADRFDDESALENPREHISEVPAADFVESPAEVLPDIAAVEDSAGAANEDSATAQDEFDGQDGQEEPDWDGESPSGEPGQVYEGPPHEPRRGNEALIIKHTCRSGEVIRYPGDVVVFGDVNPGAVIIADGDIIVLGSLRGMAQAGAEDNPKATILALNLETQRLQIGQHAGEAPRESKRHRHGNRNPGPQIAYLRRGSVFVAPFTRRREEYQGGILYEG